jgi:large-conductance mechanosensitive channel|tara:strand:+ start:934 stop:1266 length:333 start_codon:yes stop_codon:yes gene_type:complete
MKLYNEFILFLKNNSILTTIIATVMSTQINDLTNSIADDLILPVIYRDGDNDGKADIKKLENYKLILYGTKLKVGKFCVVLIKVTVIFLVLFFIKKFFFNNELPKVKLNK